MFPKLFVTDLDGTALGGGYKPYDRFPDPFSDFLDYLHDNGCQWAINTTWDAGGQWNLIERSKVKSKPIFFMAEFGLRISKYTSDGPKLIQPYTDEMEKQLLVIQQKVFRPFVRDICSRFYANKMHFFGHLFSFAAISDCKEELNDYLTEHYSEEKELRIDYNNGNLGAVPTFLDKGVALDKVLKILSISPEDVLIAGDEVADVAMMKPNLAKFAICPENAAEEVKKHVIKIGGQVGSGHSGDGIIDAFQKLYKLKIK